MYVCMYVYIYICIHIYIYIYFNLFILHNNSFDNPGSEINKNDISLRFGILSLQKLSSYYTFNKFTSSYHSSCLRL